ncbi:MAG: hypothetical protein WA364_01565 [Candidatus Nitrosopolaris sp.]
MPLQDIIGMPKGQGIELFLPRTPAFVFSSIWTTGLAVSITGGLTIHLAAAHYDLILGLSPIDRS